MDVVALDGGTDVGGVGFVVVFVGVDADDDDGVVFVFVFEEGEVGEDVHAVDAAVAPEVEDDDVAFQVAPEREGLVGVEPGEVGGEVGGVDDGVHGVGPNRKGGSESVIHDNRLSGEDPPKCDFTNPNPTIALFALFQVRFDNGSLQENPWPNGD